MKKKERTGAPEADRSDDFQCRRSRFVAQNHETDSLEWRFAVAGSIRGRCSTHEEMWRKQERVREAVAMRPRSKAWRDDVLRNLEEGLPRLTEDDLERAPRSCKATTGCRL